jgi:hypothetical protein
LVKKITSLFVNEWDALAVRWAHSIGCHDNLWPEKWQEVEIFESRATRRLSFPWFHGAALRK